MYLGGRPRGERASFKDPADRFIAATAIHHAMPLVTADEPLLTWSHPLVRIDARQ